MVEYKPCSLQLYDIIQNELVPLKPGRIAIVQATKQLDEHHGKLAVMFGVLPIVMASLLTNGRSWILLRKQMVAGKGVYFHTHLIDLMDDENHMLHGRYIGIVLLYSIGFGG